MSSNETRADYLENGPSDHVGADEAARLDVVRSILGEAGTWEEPSSELRARVIGPISADRIGTNWWMWAAIALSLVLATLTLVNAFQDDGDRERRVAATIAMEGTALAPDATGTAGLIPTPNGWAIAFDVTGLPPAGQGTFYEAWVDDGTDAVSVGTFHMRGDVPTPIALWSGVDLHDYRTINVTLETEGDGPGPSSTLVMSGSAAPFD